MRLLFAITLPGICAVFSFGQSIKLGTSAFENDRFEIEATSDTDALLILERFDSNNLDSPSTTPVDMALGQASIPQNLTDPSGIQLATRAFFQGTLGPIELPETGTYTLEVGEADNPSTGIYSIVVDLSEYASSL